MTAHEAYDAYLQAQEMITQAKESSALALLPAAELGCPTCGGGWLEEDCQNCCLVYLRCATCRPLLAQNGWCEACTQGLLEMIQYDDQAEEG